MPTLPRDRLSPSHSSTPVRHREESRGRGSHEGRSIRGVQGSAGSQGGRRSSASRPHRGASEQPPPSFADASNRHFPAQRHRSLEIPRPRTPLPPAHPTTAMLWPVGQGLAIEPGLAALMREARREEREGQRAAEDLALLQVLQVGADLWTFINQEDADLFAIEFPLLRGGGVPQDRESVMELGRREATQKSIKAIRAAFPYPFNRAGVMRCLATHLEHMAQGSAPVPSCLQVMRLGVTELVNARRTLEGSWRELDRSARIMDNMPFLLGGGSADTIGFADLVTLIWTAIRLHQAKAVPGQVIDPVAKTEADREDMVNRLYMAFAESIEVDCSEERQPGETDAAYHDRMQAVSFRACPVGLAERLISVLEGYHDEVQYITMRPTPPDQEELPRCTVAELLAEFCRELRQRYGDDPTPEKVGKTFRRALRRAHKLWGEHSNLTASFTRQLHEWLERDHDFVLPKNVNPLLESEADDAYSDMEANDAAAV